MLNIGCGLKDIRDDSIWTVTDIKQGGAVYYTDGKGAVGVINKRDIPLWFTILPVIPA